MTDPITPAQSAPTQPVPVVGATSVTQTIEDGLTLATGVKTGWKTSEFWLKAAAIVLTVLFSTGTIKTGGTAETVAGIAATILGALGYTVCRTWAKKA